MTWLPIRTRIVRSDTKPLSSICQAVSRSGWSSATIAAASLAGDRTERGVAFEDPVHAGRPGRHAGGQVGLAPAEVAEQLGLFAPALILIKALPPHHQPAADAMNRHGEQRRRDDAVHVGLETEVGQFARLAIGVDPVIKRP